MNRHAADGIEIPHLAGPAAMVRQVIAAHFVADCPHILEIGGHLRPVTPHLHHRPESVLVVDPKVVAYEADELNGAPCRVRHVARKFQEIDYDLPAGQYGLVLLGYSLKPFGARNPLGDVLFRLIDNARVIVLEYPPALERAAAQVPHILGRKSLKTRCSIGLSLDDDDIAGSPYAERRFLVLDPIRPEPRA
jgi:hypothetical protein